MHRTRRIALAALLVVATVTGVTFPTAPAFAQSDTPLGDVLGGETASEQAMSGLSATWEAIWGYQDRAVWTTLAAKDQTASEEMGGVATYFNANNATLMDYANARRDFTSNETVEFTLRLNGETTTRYIVANATDGNLTRAEIITSTNRTETHVLEVCNYAADQSHEELETFTTEYAEPNESVDAAYLGKMKGRYGDDVETTLFPSDGDCSEAGA